VTTLRKQITKKPGKKARFLFFNILNNFRENIIQDTSIYIKKEFF